MSRIRQVEKLGLAVHGDGQALVSGCALRLTARPRIAKWRIRTEFGAELK